MKLLVKLVIFCLVGALAIGVWATYVPLGGEPPRTGTVVIEKGQPASDICRQLTAMQVTGSASRCYWIGRALGQWGKIRVGEYEISSTQSLRQVFGTLTSGVSIRHRFTIAEGANLFEIARALEERKLGLAAKFIEVVRRPSFLATVGLTGKPSAEGYLYPETYMLDRTMGEEDVARTMLQLFARNWDAKWDRRAEELGLTRHQVVTLASMIEKETGAAHERPLISSVFHNRLRKKMRLQSDPTTIYGIWERYSGNLRRADLLEATPYNTYAIAALPMGPIANPGREALQAALYPATSDFLYFVSHNDGTHEFTRTYEDHLAAVRRWQLNPQAREGKSWRDLKKPAPAER